MAIFKCKMCGGTISFNPGDTVGVCEYCGSKQTLPRLDNDKKASMYERANHFRRTNDFDKAANIYEQILNEDKTDAEAYWSLVLCRYGIEYVEDPSTHKRVPTVNRVQFTSIFNDDDYKSALEHADEYQREIYKEEAKTIDEIQKGILAISSKEEPFDIFICYKETDSQGRRTIDSVLAYDIYNKLTKEGYKVFFSRVTLEDKLGAAYEPYIFAALNSAKIMIAIGTKPEYFNAVWVKNEWSRYLALIKNGADKTLIPAYRDMNPYDLPEEFSYLQALDMSKLGFMQDLVHGIKKIVNLDAQKKTIVKENIVINDNNVAPLLKRGFMFLEDENWESASEYFDRVLDIEPENASAYLGKLLSDLNVTKQDELRNQDLPFDDNGNYQKVIRFCDEELKSELKGAIDWINARNKKVSLERQYELATQSMITASNEDEYKKAGKLFEDIIDYLDSKNLAEECYEKAEEARKDKILSEGKLKMTENIDDCNEALKLFESISGWKDADESAEICKREIHILNKKIESERLEQESIAKRNKTIAIIVISILSLAFIFKYQIIPNKNYHNALKLMDDEKYAEAISIFDTLDNFKDSAEINAECKFLYATELMNEEKYAEAYDIFKKLDEYKDSGYKAFLCTKGIIKNSNKGDYVFFGRYEQDNNFDNGEEDIEWIVLEKENDKALLISKYALDCEKFDLQKARFSSWKSSFIRKSLESFYKTAFVDYEQNAIATTTIITDENLEYTDYNGYSTQDKVFLLSIDEINKYFKSYEEMLCKPTNYARFKGSYMNEDGFTVWWTRSRGGCDECASYSDDIGEGYRFRTNCYGFLDDISVRPALWINFS